MPISYNYNAIFVHIPKTGGQSVSSMLKIPKGSMAHFYWEGRTHLTLPMLENEYNVDVSDKYIFTFVRNPYTKILSEWAWRMRNITSVIYNEPTRNVTDFPEYMETLLERWDKLVEPHREKAHVIPQVDFLDERVNVFRYENFQEDCQYIMDHLGIEGYVPKVNVGRYTAKHTKRTIEITRMLYEIDFKALNYDIDAIHIDS